jgi:hypothetical protein
MTDDITKAARQYHAYLDQGDLWVPNGKPPVRIADMDPAWRHNAAAFMVRNAKGYEFHYSLGEVLSIWGGQFAPRLGSMSADAVEQGCEEAQAERAADPEAWVKTTQLYRALVKDLPDDIAEIAKHWSDCPVRNGDTECRCWVAANS